MEKHTYSNIIEHPRAGWVEQQIIQRPCQIGAPAARSFRNTDEIIKRTLNRLAQVKRGLR